MRHLAVRHRRQVEFRHPYCPNIAADMAKQLSYDLSKKLDDVTTTNLKAGKLISKEEIHPVFLRVDSELADKSKK